MNAQTIDLDELENLYRQTFIYRFRALGRDEQGQLWSSDFETGGEITLEHRSGGMFYAELFYNQIGNERVTTLMQNLLAGALIIPEYLRNCDSTDSIDNNSIQRGTSPILRWKIEVITNHPLISNISVVS